MTPKEEETLLIGLENAARDMRAAVDRSDKPNLADLPEGRKQILLVESYAMYTSNWISSAANPVTNSQPYISVTGRPSPSSEVTSAYIRFVDAADIAMPRYSAAAKRIQLFLDYRCMPQILTQLSHANRYLWIGHYAGGHYYGDLHSSD
ncbi:MAG: hypothetical protein ABJG73_15055 [Tateyamaria sp.]